MTSSGLPPTRVVTTGSPRGHRFQDGDRESLGQGGLHEDLAHLEQRRDVVAKAEEPDARLDAEAPRLLPERGFAITAPGDEEHRCRARLQDFRPRLQQKAVPLDLVQAAHRQHHPIAGAEA